MKDLTGRVAVVTGGGSGIGRGMVLAFAEAGMKVVISDIDTEAAGSVCDEVQGLGSVALAMRVDVAKRDEFQALADRVWREFGGAHLLCNNAGVTTFGLMCDGISDADWRWVLSVNLQGAINGLQAFLPRMRELEGEKHVVNTASTAGVGPSPLVAPYAASKHGLVGISETLRMEGAPHGISCSVLCPSTVKTRIVESERNRHTEFGGPKQGVSNEGIAAHTAAVGLDPLWVGRMVRQAVIDDVPFIFTHADTRTVVDARYRAMVESFEWAARWAEASPEEPT
jgi:NAD(P)-dependent dehydrogenase (short-subunit alcohol dehydrogenase family)